MTARPAWLRTALAWGGGVVVMVLLVLWLSGAFHAKIAPGEPAVFAARAAADAPTAPVTLETLPVLEEAAGTVQAERRTVISARLLATIAAVRVRAGDEVQAGDVLIELDAREPSAKAEEARRALDAAEAERARRAADLQRARTLLARGVVSQSEFDQTEAAAKVAEATAARARQAIEGADVALSYTRITAPVSGRVVDRYAEPGDTATPGQPLLAVYDPSALRIEVPVRESLLGHLRAGDALEVRIGERTLRGTVDEIVPQAEAGSRTFLVKIGLPRGAGIYTGMFGRAIIPAGERQRLLVPRAAVQRVGQLEFVDVVGPERAVSRRLVTLGSAAGDRVEVLSGLRPGEQVLVF